MRAQWIIGGREGAVSDVVVVERRVRRKMHVMVAEERLSVQRTCIASISGEGVEKSVEGSIEVSVEKSIEESVEKRAEESVEKEGRIFLIEYSMLERIRRASIVGYCVERMYGRSL